jgi:hypothetical protein
LCLWDRWCRHRLAAEQPARRRSTTTRLNTLGAHRPPIKILLIVGKVFRAEALSQEARQEIAALLRLRPQ